MSRSVTFIIPATFARTSKAVFTEVQIETVKAKLAHNPELGALIPGTGGARKMRQFGIRGQSRVVYYFHMGDDEIYFLTCYPKNRKDDLSEAEKQDLKELVALIRDAKERRDE